MTQRTTIKAQNPKMCSTTARPSRIGSLPIALVLKKMATSTKAIVRSAPCHS